MGLLVRSCFFGLLVGLIFSVSTALADGPRHHSPRAKKGKCQAGELKIGPHESHLDILEGTSSGKRCIDLDAHSTRTVDLTRYHIKDIASAEKFLVMHYPHLDLIRIDDSAHDVSMAPHGAPCSNGKNAPPSHGLFQTETCKPVP